MQSRLLDLLIGLCIGLYITPTIVLFGIVLHWPLISLCITLLIISVKKLWWFLWKKFIQAVKNELSKDLL